MLYSLKNEKTGKYYNFRQLNYGPLWEDFWWFAYLYHSKEKIDKHHRILTGKGLNVTIEEHTKLELTSLPKENWKR